MCGAALVTGSSCDIDVATRIVDDPQIPGRACRLKFQRPSGTISNGDVSGRCRASEGYCPAVCDAGAPAIYNNTRAIDFEMPAIRQIVSRGP